jgi:hypothetical protein
MASCVASCTDALSTLDGFVDSPILGFDERDYFNSICSNDAADLDLLSGSHEDEMSNSVTHNNCYEGAKKGIVDFMVGDLEQAVECNEVTQDSYDSFWRLVHTS